MYRRFTKFASDEAGLTAIEFSLIGAIVSISAVVALESINSGALLGYMGVAVDWCLALFS